MSTPLAPGQVIPAHVATIDVGEITRRFLVDNLNPELVKGGVFVGGATDAAQQAGCVALADAGGEPMDSKLPVTAKRVQVRCMGGTLHQAEEVGKYVFGLLKHQRWLEIESSDGHVWLVHGVRWAAQPSQHLDSSETWEVLGFVVVTVGTDPVS